MIPILYGSQTGNSAYFARLIKAVFKFGYNKETIHNHREGIIKCNAEALEMDEFNLEALQLFPTIIFVCSTHGDGDEPFNMRLFWRFLKLKSLPSDFLSFLSFAVYGLGDSSYSKFNYCAKRLFNRLKNLGAVELINRCDGDSQDIHGYMTTFKPWIERLSEKINIASHGSKIEKSLYIKPMLMYKTIVTGKNLITPKDYQFPILQVNLEINEYKDFYPGDCIGVLPENYNYKEFIEYNVCRLTDRDSYSRANQFIALLQLPIDEIDPIEYLIRSYFDINAMPFQGVFREMAIIADHTTHFLPTPNIPHELIQTKLYELSQDYDRYYEYVLKSKRTFFEVIQDFSFFVDINFLINFIPKINIRYFTLIKNKNVYSLSISLVEYETTMRSLRKGLCSEYLKGINIGTIIQTQLGKSQLYFNKKKMIFICTGTGITFPLSVLNHFNELEAIIFYGFRYKSKDRLNIEALINGNKVTLYEAPSRESPCLYVQEVFKKHFPPNIEDFLVFVSGNSRLNKEIREVFMKIYGGHIPFQSETW